MPDVIRVVAAVIKRNDYYLICKRPKGKRHGGLWEFPGGKVEEGENIETAARRELAEELDLSVLSFVDYLFVRHLLNREVG
jgi:8-oxo-dGTP diphosphatase